MDFYGVEAYDISDRRVEKAERRFMWSPRGLAVFENRQSEKAFQLYLDGNSE